MKFFIFHMQRSANFGEKIGSYWYLPFLPFLLFIICTRTRISHQTFLALVLCTCSCTTSTSMNMSINAKYLYSIFRKISTKNTKKIFVVLLRLKDFSSIKIQKIGIETVKMKKQIEKLDQKNHSI